MARLFQDSQWQIASEAVFCSGTEEYSPLHRQQTQRNNTMKLSRLAFAALSLSALTAFADDMDPSGQFAATAAAAPATRAAVQAQLVGYRHAGVNPWSTSYNPLKSFQSQKTRAQVTGEYLASRGAVAAMTAEDSGSAFLAARQQADAARQLAGQPARTAQ
jgi:hypothetical protein